MEFVQPIRDTKQIEAVKRSLLSNKDGKRDHLLFVLGINSGLRISDILKLEIGDVFKEGKVVDRIKVKEKKTKKTKDFPIGKNTKDAIAEYISILKAENLAPGAPLFRSTKGGPITRVRAWQILNEAASSAGINDRIGTHTLRKTYGYHLYKKGTDITRIQKLLNHSSAAITLSYIGITRQELDDIVLNLNL